MNERDELEKLDDLDIQHKNNKTYINYDKNYVNFLNGPLRRNEIEDISFSNNYSDITTLKDYWDVSKNQDIALKLIMVIKITTVYMK